MDKTLILEDLAQLLMVDAAELDSDFPLGQSEYWDSLSVVSTVGAIDQHYNVTIEGTSLLECATIGEIFQLIEQKLQENVA